MTLLAVLSIMGEAIAQPISSSPKQLSTTSNLIPTDNIPTTQSILSDLSLSSPVDPTITAQGNSTRSVLIREVRGHLTIKGQSVKVGDRLSVSDNEITTDNNSTATLEIDNYIGIIELAENTTIKIESLSPDSIKSDAGIYVVRGRVRLSIAKFVSKNSTSSSSNQSNETRIASLSNLTGIGEINQLAQTTTSAKNAPVRVRTPRGVAGVRGTSFGVNVGPNGKTGVDTIDGSVGVLGTSKEVAVNAGYWSIINPEGEPTVTKVNPTLSTLRIRSLSRLGSRNFRMLGQVQPMDLLYVNGQAIVTDADGKFRIEGELPSGRRVKIVVRGPSVRERIYELAVP